MLVIVLADILQSIEGKFIGLCTAVYFHEDSLVLAGFCWGPQNIRN